MPELPEVETTLRGIKKYIVDEKITDVVIRFPRLRWPISKNLPSLLKGQRLLNLTRRSKYLLFSFKTGALILHLGMSGRLRLLDKEVAPLKHDHIDIQFSNGKILRFNDARRFGAALWTEDTSSHPLLKDIGPEPLTRAFSGDYLWQAARKRKVAVKSFLMNGKIVAGLGNIYVTEALYAAGIYPFTPAADISRTRYQRLATEIKKVLQKAIKKGGTTLKDFMRSDGSPGYFSIELHVYGRAGKACHRCRASLKSSRAGARATVYCGRCQT